MQNLTKIYHYFGQNTQEWHEVRTGKFTSSQIYRLFGQVTKNDRIRAAIEKHKITGKLDTYNYSFGTITNTDMNDVWKILHPNLKVSDLDCKETKDGIKGFIKETNGTKTDTRLSEKGAYLIDIIMSSREIEVLPKSALTYIEELAIEIAYEKQDVGEEYKAMEWGNEYEPIASECFRKNNIYAADFPKIAFCEIKGMETGASPDDTENKTKPSEYKCPITKKVHKHHTQLKTDLDLLAYDAQKYYQIHHQIWVLGAKYGFWSSYDDRLLGVDKMKHKALHTIKIERNEELCKQFLSRITQATQIRDQMVADFRSK
jgi:hypothetical protein